jgi:hypothetical protein
MVENFWERLKFEVIGMLHGKTSKNIQTTVRKMKGFIRLTGQRTNPAIETL